MKSIIRLVIRPGRNVAFEKAFVNSGMLSRPKLIDPGFAGDLLRSRAEPETYFVVATWSSAEAYAEWQAHSQEGADHEALAILNDVLVDPVPGTLFEVVASSSCHEG